MKIQLSDQYEETSLVIDGINHPCQGNVARYVRDRGITDITSFKTTSEGVVNFVKQAAVKQPVAKAAAKKAARDEALTGFKTALTALVSEVKNLKGAKWAPLIDGLRDGLKGGIVALKPALVAFVSEVKNLKGAKWAPLIVGLREAYVDAFVK